MKNILISILALIYFTATTGTVISMHYCMGQMTGWELGKGNSSECGSSGMKDFKQQKKTCCNDEQKFVKDNNDQNITEPLFDLQQTEAVALTAGFIEINNVAFYSFLQPKLINPSPPGSRKVALYLSNRVFRI